MTEFDSDKEAVFKEIDLTDDEKRILFESISRKMAPTPMKLRAEFELTCFTYEGIDALKEALITARTKVNQVDPASIVVSVSHSSRLQINDSSN